MKNDTVAMEGVLLKHRRKQLQPIVLVETSSQQAALKRNSSSKRFLQVELPVQQIVSHHCSLQQKANDTLLFTSAEQLVLIQLCKIGRTARPTISLFRRTARIKTVY